MILIKPTSFVDEAQSQFEYIYISTGCLKKIVRRLIKYQKIRTT